MSKGAQRSQRMTNSLSVIIPTYNERHTIEKSISKLSIFPKETEIIFSDGGSTDGTVEFLNTLGKTIFSSPKGRGNQLNFGAKNSNGDILLFLHADTYFLENPVQEIQRILTNHHIGAFTLKFQSSYILAKTVAFFSSRRIKKRNIAFGDQGMFMKKEFYEKLGGFKNIPLMEDYDFSIRTKNLGYKIGLSPVKIYTSPRKFEKEGYLSTIIKMQYCQHLFRKGEDVNEIRKIYG